MAEAWYYNYKTIRFAYESYLNIETGLIVFSHIGLPKTSSGDVVSFRGWPSLQWVSTEKLPRPPRDWIPPPRPAEDSPAHIEHTSAADGSAMGVIVTR